MFLRNLKSKGRFQRNYIVLCLCAIVLVGTIVNLQPLSNVTDNATQNAILWSREWNGESDYLEEINLEQNSHTSEGGNRKFGTKVSDSFSFDNQTAAEFFDDQLHKYRRRRVHKHFESEIFSDNINPRHRVCRVPNACLSKNGTVIVERQFEKLKDLLMDFGIEQLSFHTIDSEKEIFPYFEFDLFGHDPARYHMPHFLTDILPMVFASAVTQRSKLYSHSTAHCIPSNTSCSRKRFGRIRAALLTDNRVRPLKLSSWVPQVSKMLPGLPVLAFPETIFKNASIACFNSIILYNKHRIMFSSPEWIANDDYRINNHGFIRERKYKPTSMDHYEIFRSSHGLIQTKFNFTKNRSASTNVSPYSDKTCVVRVLILNRKGWERRGFLLKGRDIVNAEDLATHLSSLFIRNGRQKVKFVTRIQYFEDEDFRSQVKAMEDVDIIIGAHGAGMSNMLFAKKGTSIIEIVPFGYYAGPFDTVATALFLPYDFIVARPDAETYLECLTHLARKAENSSMAIDGRNIWNDAVKIWSEDGRTDHIRSQLYPAEISLQKIKVCIRTQRMKVNILELSKKVVALCRHYC